MKKMISFIAILAFIVGFCWYSFEKLDDYDEPVEKPKMRKFLLNKLWRDKAASKLDKVKIHITRLDDQEYEKQLNLKLIEEAEEVVAAIHNPENLISEIGDVLEVLECIALFHKISWKDVIAKKIAKRDERGSYVDRQYVTIAECAPDSWLLSYYMKEPGRHVEIFD